MGGRAHVKMNGLQNSTVRTVGRRKEKRGDSNKYKHKSEYPGPIKYVSENNVPTKHPIAFLMILMFCGCDERVGMRL